MTAAEHAKRTKKLVGIRAEDIHKWIDGFFDAEGFDKFLLSGRSPDFNPYDHRRHRHCREALEEAYEEFGGKYTREQIKAVFESHVRDDYDGYLPSRLDFLQGTFSEKYHEEELDSDHKDAIFSPEELSDYFKGKKDAQQKSIKQKGFGFFANRFVLPTILAIVLFVSSIYFIVIPLFTRSIMDRKKEMIRELTATAVSAIEFYVEQEEMGILPMEAAQKQAASEIQKMRYGRDRKDYFWVTDMHPRMIIHPYRQDLIGTDLTHYRDSEDKSGKFLFVEFADMVREKNHGWLEYLWQWKDDSTRTAPKLSYVEGIPRWGWIVGTGIYIHDVQQETNKLSRSLFLDFAIITLLLVIIMGYVLLQSRRIENQRLKAEDGLRAAKERYRALAESSKEGYLLESGGRFIYSNHVLHRMTGYTEEELTDFEIWEKLLPKIQINTKARSHLFELNEETVSSSEVKAQIHTRSGAILDVIMSTSRIFFRDRIGHVITLRPISRQQIQDLKSVLSGTALPPQSLTHETGEDIAVNDPIEQLIGEINQSETEGHVIHALNMQPEQIRQMLYQGVKPMLIRKNIGRTYHTALKRFVELTIRQIGDPPVPFTFLSLGSNARFEMTLFSDQDNAIVYTDLEDEDPKKVQRYFLNLGDAVCTRLAQAGFPFCPGGIMASNPRWCMPLSQWQRAFKKWIETSKPDSIVEMNVFFDLLPAYGESVLVDSINRAVTFHTKKNPEFLLHFAQNCLLYKPPLNLSGQIKTENKDGMRSMNIKECIKPIERFARLYALKNEITVPDTVSRLKNLYQSNILNEHLYQEMLYAFDFLWQLRFTNQIISHADLQSIYDDLDPEMMTDVERKNLQTVLNKINDFQNQLSDDFLGTGV